MLFDLLQKEFTTMTFIPNDKTLLSGFEVDIAVPALRLAIEWNGIVHFKPIYGVDKLQKIQQRDTAKLALANQLDINLIVIPDLVSNESTVKEAFIHISKIIRSIT